MLFCASPFGSFLVAINTSGVACCSVLGSLFSQVPAVISICGVISRVISVVISRGDQHFGGVVAGGSKGRDKFFQMIRQLNS